MLRIAGSGPNGPSYPPLKLPMVSSDAHTLARLWDKLGLIDDSKVHFINDNFELLELTIISAIFEEINSNSAYSYEGTFIATLQLLTIIVYNLDRKEALPYDLIRRVALINSRVFNLSRKDYRLLGDALFKCIFELKMNRHSLSRTKESASSPSSSCASSRNVSLSLGHSSSLRSPSSLYSNPRDPVVPPSIDSVSINSYRTNYTSPTGSRKPSTVTKTTSYLSLVDNDSEYETNPIYSSHHYHYNDDNETIEDVEDDEELGNDSDEEDDIYSLSSASVVSQKTHIPNALQHPRRAEQVFCHFYAALASYLYDMDKYDPMLEFHERRDSFDTLSSGTELHTLSQTSDGSYWQHGPFVYSNGATNTELPLTSQEVKQFAESHPVLTLDSSDEDDESFDFINMFEKTPEVKATKVTTTTSNSASSKRELRLFGSGKKRRNSFGTVITRVSSKASGAGKDDCVIV